MPAIAVFTLCLALLPPPLQTPRATEGDRQSAPSQGTGASEEIHLPSGTPLVIEIDRTLPMRLGEAVHGRLVYAVYSANRLLLPQGTPVSGHVVELRPDRTRRIEARLRADFTPFVTPALQFDSVQLAGGRTVPISTGVTADGASVIRLKPDPPRKGGLLRQQLGQVRQIAGDRLAVVAGPDKRERLVKLLYSQLPYHPQRIEKGTSWTSETTRVTELPFVELSTAAVVPQPPTVASSQVSEAPSWQIQAYLREEISSRNAHVGEQVYAEVAEPVLKADRTLAVPQGAILEGEVTEARPARRFGRAGVVRFDFRRLRIPGSDQVQAVQSSLTGIDAAGGQKLTLGAEGQVKPKPQDKVVVPLLLFALAGRPLDHDRGDNLFGKDAVASNSLGLAGFIVGTAAGQRNLAAGIGYYGAAISVYNRWIKRGADISFRRNTRVELQTTARRSMMLNDAPGPNRDRR